MDANERRAREADDDLQDHLSGIVGIVDPAPPDLQRVASDLLCWRTVDSDLAELLRTRAPAD